MPVEADVVRRKADALPISTLLGGAASSRSGSFGSSKWAASARPARRSATQTMSPTRSSSTIVKLSVASGSGERTCASSAAVPTVGWPAKGSSRAGVKILMLAVLIGFRGSNTNTVSERLNSAAIACMWASSSPSLSSTTASGLPASPVSVKTSSVKKRRVIPGKSSRLRRAATRDGQVVRQSVQTGLAHEGVVDFRHVMRVADRVQRVAAVLADAGPRASGQIGLRGGGRRSHVRPPPGGARGAEPSGRWRPRRGKGLRRARPPPAF